MPAVAPRINAIPRSGIRAIMDRAWALGEPIVHLEVGQPDFDPPPHVIEAAARAVREGATRYTPNAGIPELREACVAKLGAVNGVRCAPDEVMVTAGSTQALSLAMLALLAPGDEVLLPDPGWPNYQMAVASVNARSVPYRLHAAAGFRPDLEEIAALITERTRMLVVNSPSNPLGTVLDPGTLAGLIDIARRYDLWVLSDECYDQIVFEGRATAAAAVDGAGEHVIAVYSMSKTYAMTGFRVGYVTGPAPVIAAMVKLQEAQVACVNAAAQWASVAALTGPQDAVAEAVSAYRQRRDLAVEIAQARGLSAQPPAGAFYLWVELHRQVEDSTLFATRLLDQERVAVAPGLTFGSGGRSAVRVALAASADAITDGMERLASFATTA